MAIRIGGETPIVKYGLTISAECPAATSSTVPVLEGQLFKLDGTLAADGSGVKLVAATAGDKPSTVILAYALDRSEDPLGVIGVMILTGQATQIRRLKYTGGAPTVGHSVAISASDVRAVVDLAFARGDGLILSVDTAATEVEVLI